jgi:Cu(I)/Ag(I) efflux system protein CusF
MKSPTIPLLSGLVPALPLLATFLLAAPLPASAHGADGHDAHAGHGMSSSASASAMLVDGQVRKIDKASGKVTVSHGPLTNLNMPAMTMVFRLKEAAWLNQLQPEQKIRFVADSINGTLTIVRLEMAK